MVQDTGMGSDTAVQPSIWLVASGQRRVRYRGVARN
jgi:hypothetical protein